MHGQTGPVLNNNAIYLAGFIVGSLFHSLNGKKEM